MKSLMQNPEEHQNYGTTMRWKTAKGLIPKRLDPDKLEDWLWNETCLKPTYLEL